MSIKVESLLESVTCDRRPREGANKSSCLSMLIKACYSRRVPNVNSGSIFEVLNKEYRLLDHALRVFQSLLLKVTGHMSLRLFERYLHSFRAAPYLTISLKD